MHTIKLFFIKPHIALELSLVVNPTPAVKYLIVHKGRLEEAEVYEETVVGPQWWSFADVSQQGLDFSKKSVKEK